MAAALTVGFASCESDEFEAVSVASSNGKTITVNAVVGNGALTRAMIDLENQVDTAEYFQWKEGDIIWFNILDTDANSLGDNMYVFSITDYSNDSPSATATFSGTLNDDDSIEEGDVVIGVFSGNSIGYSSDHVNVGINTEYEMESNSEEELEDYMYYNINMFAKTTYSDSGTNFSFEQLSTMARITYLNSTDETQIIENVSISSSLPYFGSYLRYFVFEEYYEAETTTYEISQTFTSGVEVAAQDSVDFYLLFLPSGTEFTSYGSIYVNINEESVEMNPLDLQTTTFEAGCRYWLDVEQTSDGLAWRNYEKSDLVDSDYVMVERTDNNEDFCNYLSWAIDGVILDANGNALVPSSAIESTTEMSLGVSNVEGIGVFENLEYLYCIGCGLTDLDLTGLVNLKQLHCWNNSLTTLDVSGCPALEYIGCDQNELTEIIFGENTALTYLDCSSNSFETLDVSNLALESLDVDDNPLTTLICSGNNLTYLSNISSLTTLTYLDCSNNSLTYLDLSDLISLTYLDCSGNQLSSMDLSGFEYLEEWYCGVQTDYTICLTLSEDQLTIWTESLESDPRNEDIYIPGYTYSGSAVGEEGGVGLNNFKNGGKY